METEEWLVTDPRGAFAMGTAAGVRARKYHGFYLGIAGRTETAFLADLEMRLDGRDLWPHAYASPDGPVVHPDPRREGLGFEFEVGKSGPRWTWTLPTGKLRFGLTANASGGIRLNWKWQGAARGKPVTLELRPFWVLRPLHSIGGESWTLRISPDVAGRVATVTGSNGRAIDTLWESARGSRFEWKEDPDWYRSFEYAEEVARGYPAREDLYSAGRLVVELSGSSASHSWVIGREEEPVLTPVSRLKGRPPALDFVLIRPSGVVAGYPWFGEWGRDTFIALPGIVMAWLRAGGDPDEVWEWAQEVLLRWGAWIRLNGMIPNVIEKEGRQQWDSADGTLWWCHALAALWTFSLGSQGPAGQAGKPLFEGIEARFGELLSLAISSIASGDHQHLAPAAGGLLEVTSPHATWMDARVDGAAVTPRLGALPEINALWFQARCLQWIWAGSSPDAAARELEALGNRALGCREPQRPNTVFLHSIPLAPSFVLKDWGTLGEHMDELTRNLWTPVGLRTLSPIDPAYRPACVGDQRARDQAYHQGSPWGWLGGHYEMARQRQLGRGRALLASASNRGRAGGALSQAHAASPPHRSWPIAGHMPELFDAEAPFAPRGAPAQAWSVACFEEAQARRRGKIDAKLTKLLARRWLARMERGSGGRMESSP